jgi:hypothetical protein
MGILATVLGTVLLAFSLKIRRQYEGETAKVVDKMKRSNGLLEPTETYIIRPLFWLGLGLIASGSLLQW